MGLWKSGYITSLDYVEFLARNQIDFGRPNLKLHNQTAAARKQVFTEPIFFDISLLICTLNVKTVSNVIHFEIILSQMQKNDQPLQT